MGCVVVDPSTGAIVSRGRNATNVTKNVKTHMFTNYACNILDFILQGTRHAEFLAADALIASYARAGVEPPSPLFNGLDL